MDIRGFDQQIEEISHSTKDMEKENRLLLKRAKELENEKVLIQEDIERIDDQSQGIDQDVQELLHHFDEKKSEQEKTREEMAKIETFPFKSLGNRWSLPMSMQSEWRQKSVN